MAIIVCPLSHVLELVETRRPDRIVSLLDPHYTFPDVRPRKHLQLGVHDITEIYEGHTPPMQTHVAHVLKFVSDWDRAAPILVHCYAGISRSTATAYTIACALNPDADETVIAKALRKASPTAWPNTRIVALADAELGRGGRMVKAIEKIGDGASWEDIGEARPFEIPSVFGARK